MTATTQTPLELLDAQFKSLYDEVGTAGKQMRSLQDGLKNLQKSFKLMDKQNKLRKKRPQVPLNLSNDLEKFLSIKHGTMLTKAQVMKSISTYIKEKNLQVQENKRTFVPNKELSKIFKMKKPSALTFVEINKHVSHHLSK